MYLVCDIFFYLAFFIDEVFISKASVEDEFSGHRACITKKYRARVMDIMHHIFLHHALRKTEIILRTRTFGRWY